jgi:hypothetical protein
MSPPGRTHHRGSGACEVVHEGVGTDQGRVDILRASRKWLECPSS